MKATTEERDFVRAIRTEREFEAVFTVKVSSGDLDVRDEDGGSLLRIPRNAVEK